MRLELVALAALAFATTAHGDGAELSMQATNVLTAMDTVPTPTELDSNFTDPLDSLAAIAQGSGIDVGVRIRALHALASYCTAPCNTTDIAHEALVDFITANEPNQDGTTIVMLRGAIEAIGPQRVGTDLPLLVPLLSHPSRDIRAATAHALRDLCNTQAITPLRAQQAQEASDQVKLAISEALRVLSQPSPCD
ncbi:MAG TPA: HEAT repeat domain-containing protein [Kofleriaceae bacterium]